MTVKLKDVARAAGVSQGTASNVFNRPDTVSVKLREAVLEAARSLGYRGPAPAGRALRSGRANVIAVVVEDDLAYTFEDVFTRRLLASIGEVCDEAAYGIAIVSTTTGRRHGWSIETAIADGLILFCLALDTPLPDLARRRGLPFVAINSAPSPGAPSVGIDDRAGAHAAAAHLIGLGHRRIGILSLELARDAPTGPIDLAALDRAGYLVTRERLQGYGEALAAVGLAWDAQLAHATLNDRPSVEAALNAMLAGPEPPTALLAMSDTIALAAVEVLAARGLRVPDDMSIVGFDDVPEAAAATPALTTIHQPVREKGRRAARMLLGLEAQANLILPAELVVRRSTAPPPQPRPR